MRKCDPLVWAQTTFWQGSHWLPCMAISNVRWAFWEMKALLLHDWREVFSGCIVSSTSLSVLIGGRGSLIIPPLMTKACFNNNWQPSDILKLPFYPTSLSRMRTQRNMSCVMSFNRWNLRISSNRNSGNFESVLLMSDICEKCSQIINIHISIQFNLFISSIIPQEVVKCLLNDLKNFHINFLLFRDMVA